MIQTLLIKLFKCVILTILVELVAALLLGIKNRKDILFIILVNLMTNPLMNGLSLYLNYIYKSNVSNMFVFIYEIINVFIEGFIYSKVLKKNKLNPYLLSLILNTISFLISIII